MSIFGKPKNRCYECGADHDLKEYQSWRDSNPEYNTGYYVNETAKVPIKSCQKCGLYGCKEHLYSIGYSGAYPYEETLISGGHLCRKCAEEELAQKVRQRRQAAEHKAAEETRQRAENQWKFDLEKKLRQEEEKNRAEAQRLYQEKLKEHQAKFKCAIYGCSIRSSGPSAGNWDVPTGLAKCTRCGRWACTEKHFYKGYCEDCAKKL